MKNANGKSSTHRPPRADGRLEDWPDSPAGESELFARLRNLCDEGLSISARVDESRNGVWNSFVPADYDTVLSGLMRIRERGGRFLELGSATGVVAIMADLLGLESCGIEIAPELVNESMGLARRYGSSARFATGSYLPAGYRFVAPNGDTRTGALEIGESAYPELGYQLADFDWVYAYPWPGEAEILRDLMKRHGGPRATLLLHGYTGVLEFHPPL